ncbi:MAG: hypothetical protein ACO1OQ_13640 [Rufibacter sp.]
MKRKIISFLFTLGVLLHFSACDLPPAPAEGGDLVANAQWLAYPETQCADPWGYCNKSPDKTVCVKEHLENLGVTVLEVTVKGNLGNGVVCEACSCPSGRTFKVKVYAQDVDKVLAVGFKKI